MSPLVTYPSCGTYDIDLLLGQHAVRTLQLQGLGFTPSSSLKMELAFVKRSSEPGILAPVQGMEDGREEDN